MAIVKCPECGKEISNQAACCIHCGCKITICPECGSAVLESREICPNCGMRLSVRPTLTIDSDPSVSEWKNYYNMWKTENNSFYFIKILLNALSYIFPMIVAVLLGVGVYLFQNATNKAEGNLEGLLNLGTTYKTLNSLIICFCVFIVASSITISANICILPFCISRWMSAKKISARNFFDSMVKNDHFDDDVKEVPLINQIKQACYWSDKPDKMMMGIFLNLLIIALYGLSAIFFGLSLHNNLESYYKFITFGSGVVKFTFEYGYLVVAVIAMVLGVITRLAAMSYSEKEVRAWGESPQ